MTSFILADSETCIGCRTCEAACALEHSTESSPFAPRLTVLRLDTLSIPAVCHQCENAPCVVACPVGALVIGLHRVPKLRGCLSFRGDFDRYGDRNREV